jgi:hypothetical protein
MTPLDGVAHNQIGHVLIDKRRLSIILDVLSFRGAGCGTEHFLEGENFIKLESKAKLCSGKI